MKKKLKIRLLSFLLRFVDIREISLADASLLLDKAESIENTEVGRFDIARFATPDGHHIIVSSICDQRLLISLT